MPRRIPPDRLQKLIAAAARRFVKEGYARTQMDDVARELGVSKGSLYGYVESKRALFDAVVRYTDGQLPLPGPDALPLPEPSEAETLDTVRQRLAAEAGGLTIWGALERPPGKESRSELERILREIFRVTRAHRNAIKVIDRCAPEWPELGALWFGGGREGLQGALRRYLERGIAAGALPKLPDTAIAARLALETIVFWSVHRGWDPAPQQVDEDAVEDTVVHLLLSGIAP